VSGDAGVWAQVCGPLILRIDGERRDRDLPGKQGRQLAAYLLVHRTRSVRRDELVDALWWEGLAPDGAQATLSTLLSRVRNVFGAERLEGTGELRLAAGADAWIDLEAAERGVHEAESAVAQERYAQAWAPARIALHATSRGFLPDVDAPWAGERREHVENLRLRALETVAAAGLGVGGSELPSTERAARSLIAAAPYREGGYRYLMAFFAERGDVAEALQVYERLRRLLREELGVAPSGAVADLHQRLLDRHA
jgi:SARP family transcriptional regulator, regulator of embCAB operon